MSEKPTYRKLDKTVVGRKLTEDKLRESEERYRTLFETMAQGVVYQDAQGKIISANPSAEKILGLSLDQMQGRTSIDPRWKSIHEDGSDFPGETHPSMVALNTGEEVKDVIMGVFNPQTEGYRWMSLNAVPQFKEGEDCAYQVYTTFDDITERKETEKALRESEEKYRILFEKANIGISVVQDGFVKSPNPKTLDLHGYSEEEIIAIPFINFIHPEDREMVQDRHERRLRGEELPTTYSYRILDKAGDAKWVELNVVKILWEGKPATLCFLTDITDQKQAEEKRKKLETQLQQAQKVEAIGTLAGGIAHNFNNVLMGIQGRTSLMLMDTHSSHPRFEHLKGIEEYVKNAADLTKQLLGFARGGKYEVNPTDLNELVKSQNRMLSRTKKEITVRGKYEENLWTVEVDQGQIEQVLLNLYVNAWQAMPAGGDLYIQTENVMLDEGYVKPFNMEPGRYVKISVTDTGVGMDEATRQRIFDPFFTTRDMSMGTGLGLASVYGIIKNHGGIINVYSEKGEGTTFSIYLPASEKEVIKEKEVVGEVMKGKETVLLVDDEDMIIDVGKQMVESFGYKVLVAGSGKEALDIYERNKDKIDIVILDMIMPVMSGSETFDGLKEIDPDIKVLLSSGYSINGQPTEILARGCDGFIQKPFNMKQLSQKLREILDK